MSVEENKELIKKWYIALEQGDFDTIYDMHHEDVVYNMLGNTPVSGRISVSYTHLRAHET